MVSANSNQSNPTPDLMDQDGVTARTTRVLHVINGEHYSGAERVQDLLATTLPEFGYDVAFACVKPGSFDANRQNREAPLSNVAMRTRFDLTAARRLVGVFREQKCEILHAHTPRSLMVASGAAKILGCPLVYHVHSPVGRDSKRTWANRLNTWSETRNLQQAARLICVSNSLRDYMLGLGHPEEKLRVVHNGVTVNPLEAQVADKSVFWTLGMVALFRPRKGLEVLLEAIKILSAQNLPVRLKCVGGFESESYEFEVFNLAEKLNVGHLIDWIGFERNVRARLKEMQIMVLPSQFGEGLPMVVLEAMAVGLPVIASKVEGIPEAIRDGQDGLLFTPNNPQELASQIRQLVKNRSLWSEISKSAWERQRSEFSDRSMAARVAAVYDELRFI
jgi:glycosyltransferase involved in cell wall biosynthesis